MVYMGITGFYSVLLTNLLQLQADIKNPRYKAGIKGRESLPMPLNMKIFATVSPNHHMVFIKISHQGFNVKKFLKCDLKICL